MSYVDAVKLPYRGVLIERPCSHCDTVDLHYEGECAQGPCTRCGRKRGEHYWLTEDEHDWQPATYQPALIADAPASFNAIVDAARELGMPRHFMSDIYRDYQALQGVGLWKDHGEFPRFVWAVRDTGTDLLSGHTPETTAKLLITRNEWYFLWDGSVLQQVTAETALWKLRLMRKQVDGSLSSEKFEVG